MYAGPQRCAEAKQDQEGTHAEGWLGIRVSDLSRVKRCSYAVAEPISSLYLVRGHRSRGNGDRRGRDYLHREGLIT